MKTNNEKIALFQGLTEYIVSLNGEPWGGRDYYDARTELREDERFNYGRLLHYRELKYDVSWDWLMPIVLKIHEIAPEEVREINNEGLAIFELGLTTPIEDVYNAVLEYINWHNENIK